MEKKIILTIGRQFGSGGRIIGKQIAEELGIGYYDKEIMAVAAKESGLCEEVFEKADERTASGLSYALTTGYSYMGMYMPYTDFLSNDGLFQLQSDAMRKLAAENSCVLVGRCADYILRDEPGLFSFFIHDKTENRIKRIMEYQKIGEEEARELMIKTDKSRAAYYNYYTNKTWGAANSYNFSIDASVLGTDETVALMKDFIERRQGKR
ncbi:cytidylate kinase [Parabacteroides sp. PFB2-12]|uniref:cytidylate kinase-like family protein n=1 Tax=unclassified Parabacteroides TaxID=2649774 RepID=UPI0024738CC8|nr:MULTISPECIES: cytidylate kinase-like family protein [unclassified Parabacteroides]MDH6341387.1 cytidylate kinase [Parabacteroides sp. PM6-13]MDH6389181.1 cytidylate kinase [Parabacteroides sp. PFB2-12]